MPNWESIWNTLLERIAEPIGNGAMKLWELVTEHGWPMLMVIPLLFSAIFAMTNMAVREFVLYPLEGAMVVVYGVIVAVMMKWLAKSSWVLTFGVTLTAIAYGLVPHFFIYHIYRYGLMGRWTFGYWQTLGLAAVIGAVSIVGLIVGGWLISKILAAAFAVKQWYGNQKTWVKWLVWIGLVAIVVAEAVIWHHAWSVPVIALLVIAISRSGPHPTASPTIIDPNAS